MWIEHGALRPQVVIDARLRIRAAASHATATSTVPFTPNQYDQLPPIDWDLITLPAVDNEHAMKNRLNAEQIAVVLPIIVEHYLFYAPMIVRLGESSFEPDVIAIADSHPATAADEMRSFVERYHPNAKLVTIGDSVLQPDGIAHWLSSADPASDLPVRIREVLVRPRP